MYLLAGSLIYDIIWLSNNYQQWHMRTITILILILKVRLLPMPLNIHLMLETYTLGSHLVVLRWRASATRWTHRGIEWYPRK